MDKAIAEKNYAYLSRNINHLIYLYDMAGKRVADDIDMLRGLHSAGRDVTPSLSRACETGNLEVFDFLISIDAPVTNDCITAACKSTSPHKFQILKLILPKYTISQEQSSELGQMPKVLDFNQEVIKLLYFYGYNINGADANGNTLLHLACSSNLGLGTSKDEIIKMLLELGAKQVANADGDTPLHLLCLVDEPNVDLIRLLLEYKPTISKNSKGYTPLHFPCRNNNLKLVRLLADYCNSIGIFRFNPYVTAIISLSRSN